MGIKFSCKKCGQNIEIDATSGGKIVPCPNCKASLLVPVKLQDLSLVPTLPSPTASMPAPAKKGTRPFPIFASVAVVIAALMGGCLGYLWETHVMAKADAHVAATKAIAEGKTGDVAKVEAQLAAAKALLDAKTSDVARAEAQLAALKMTLNEKTAEVTRVEAQVAAARASLNSAYASSPTSYRPPASKTKSLSVNSVDLRKGPLMLTRHEQHILVGSLG